MEESLNDLKDISFIKRTNKRTKTVSFPTTYSDEESTPAPKRKKKSRRRTSLEQPHGAQIIDVVVIPQDPSQFSEQATTNKEPMDQVLANMKQEPQSEGVPEIEEQNSEYFSCGEIINLDATSLSELFTSDGSDATKQRGDVQEVITGGRERAGEYENVSDDGMEMPPNTNGVSMQNEEPRDNGFKVTFRGGEEERIQILRTLYHFHEDVIVEELNKWTSEVKNLETKLNQILELAGNAKRMC